MNIPNILTLSRIVLAFVLVFLLLQRTETAYLLAIIVFTLASLTDFYDGHFAKNKGLISDFGKIMDPVADKILLLSAFGVLAHTGILAWWMFIVIALREIMVTLSRLLAMKQGQVIAAEWAGKIKTVIQIVAVSVILLYLAAQRSEYCSSWFLKVQNIWFIAIQGLNFLVVAVTICSGIEYFRHKKEF